VPNNYDPNTAYKLIFGYHWLGGTMTDVATGQTVQRDIWSYYGLQRLAREGSIFVAPQGINNGWANSGGEDLTFTDQMIQTIESSLCVETSLRFATGFSYGGAMSYSLACSRATGAYAFRAVAVLSSPGVLSGCESSIFASLVCVYQGLTSSHRQRWYQLSRLPRYPRRPRQPRCWPQPA
jgi:hypothetical protein